MRWPRAVIGLPQFAGFLAALSLCVVVAAGRVAGQTGDTPDPNSHLADLSQEALREVAARLEIELAFTVASAECFGEFLAARQRAADKGGENLTELEQSAAEATVSPQSWVNDCLRRREFSFSEGGTTDRFGRIEIHSPAPAGQARAPDPADRAYQIELRRLIERHESEHAARRTAFARSLGLDPEMLLVYGTAYDKLEALILEDGTYMNVHHFGHALEDLDGFTRAHRVFASDARYLLPQVRERLTEEEQQAIIWGRHNRTALDRISEQAKDAVDKAREEQDDYLHDVDYLRERLGVITGMITETPAPDRPAPETDQRKSPKRTSGTTPPDDPRQPPKPLKPPPNADPEKAANTLPEWARKAIEDAKSKGGLD